MHKLLGQAGPFEHQLHISRAINLVVFNAADGEERVDGCLSNWTKACQVGDTALGCPALQYKQSSWMAGGAPGVRRSARGRPACCWAHLMGCQPTDRVRLAFFTLPLQPALLFLQSSTSMMMLSSRFSRLPSSLMRKKVNFPAARA